ncbi:1-acylglycerophosphocholine O-acyltransferase 1-like isoform X1 [Dinothrombium tinctorium]|uniref:1-acylglycerophosphocholine O-acyltransferase 1-like isoform X1 n=1 Tax=Dinothrombium tinctorium TaxID=1965070 RepID=A0A443RMF7_9ACAR|nr:1-acylglycerophosphocholine O-acyltransferase 1-like isoform X1 [Dinothrombium tinctorium]
MSIIFIRCAIFCLGFYRIDIIDHSHLNEVKQRTNAGEPLLLLTPHSSIYDYFAVLLLDLPVFVARKTIENSWMVSKLATLGNPILVDRNEINSRKNTIEIIKERASKEQILLFPEGTNTNRNMIIRFKPGAFIPALPVQPVFIKFSTYPTETYSWTWEGPSALMGFFLTCYRWKSSMTLHKLPVYYPNNEEKMNPTLYSLNVQRFVTQIMKERMSLYSYNDVPYLQLALNIGIPRSPLGLKLLKISQKLAKLREKVIQISKNKTEQLPLNGNGLDKKFAQSLEMKDDDANLSVSGSFEQFSSEDLLIIEEMSNLTANFLDSYYENDIIKTIDNSEEIINILGLDYFENELKNSSTVDDFLLALKEGENERAITSENLATIMLLCDVRKYSLWDRIKEVILCLNKLKQESDIAKCTLTLSQYKFLIWCLLGIESAAIDDTVFDKITLDYS